MGEEGEEVEGGEGGGGRGGRREKGRRRRRGGGERGGVQYQYVSIDIHSRQDTCETSLPQYQHHWILNVISERKHRYMGTVRPTHKSKQGNTTNLNISFPKRKKSCSGGVQTHNILTRYM